MKASSTISLLSFGLLGLAQSVVPLPQEPQDFKVPSVSVNGGKNDEWVAPENQNPAINDVLFSWCRDYNMTSTCSQTTLKHSWCYDLSVMDAAIKDQLEDVGASDGRCMLFRKPDCKGEHTAMFVGLHLWTKALCPKSKTRWYRQATSVRCCAGSPVAPWCHSSVKKPEICAKN
ncbi:hypothetical protein TrVFT333_000286 [Trichoderma virens FT-333]|nr:hypothetical protein TrVFT333_000286 [Trichoderma virens FT-333]